MITTCKIKPSQVYYSAAYVEFLKTHPERSDKARLAKAERRLAELRAGVCDQHCLVCDEFMVVCVPNTGISKK